MKDRETRLRERIDRLTDERESLVEVNAKLRVELATARDAARIARGHVSKLLREKYGTDDGTHAWLAEHDRRKAERKAKKRAKREAVTA